MENGTLEISTTTQLPAPGTTRFVTPREERKIRAKGFSASRNYLVDCHGRVWQRAYFTNSFDLHTAFKFIW